MSECTGAAGLALARASKRKRCSDAVSECTHTTDCTDASQGVVDEKSQRLSEQRLQHAAERLELEEQLEQLVEQQQHVTTQLEQLEGCDGDPSGVSDLKQQLQSYKQQQQQATNRLEDLDRQFESAVANILGIMPDRHPQLLAAALQEQQQLKEVQVQQLAVEQQLGGAEFVVTNASKHQSKKARLDRISSVWDWLQGQGSTSTDCQAADNPQHRYMSLPQQHQQQEQDLPALPLQATGEVQAGDGQQSGALQGPCRPSSDAGQEPPTSQQQQQQVQGSPKAEAHQRSQVQQQESSLRAAA